MKINSQSQLGVDISKGILEGIIDTQWNNSISKLEDPEKKKIFAHQFIELFGDEAFAGEKITNILKSIGMPPNAIHFAKNRNYLLTNTAIDHANRIKIDEDKFDVRFLSKVNSKKVTFLLGKNKFIRYVKTGSRIHAGLVSVSPMPGGYQYVHFCAFKIFTDTGKILYADKPDSPLSDENFLLFIRLLIFTELSELEIIELKPKQKTGTKKQGKYINDSQRPVIIVDSGWNKMLIRADGFSVRGHFRLQPCGENREDRKLIFVNEYEKKGYVRKPKNPEFADKV